MDFDPVLLSRIQFGFVIAFHIIFPSFTIGLASYIAVLEGLWLKTNNPVYRSLSELWIKIFAVSFGMGVVSGVVMSYQFGTNWSRFSDNTANILGPLFSYEVITAFFLEATFLGILLFGRNRVPRPVHFLSAVMVALGTLTSAFWILSANSWMHTPAGYTLEGETFMVADWWAAIFNPSFPYRLAHMVTATYLTTAFVVISVAALYLLQDRFRDHAKSMLSMTFWLVTILAPLQVVIGDLHGLNTLEHQPAKIAAMEGHWETQRGAPLLLFAWPDMEAEENRFEIGIPNLGSLILTHEWDGELKGLKEWAPQDRPYVPIVFWSFRIMVGIGLIMLAMALISVVLRWRGRLYDTRWFLRSALVCGPIGFGAVLAGWVTTEVGRQPWIVYNLMRTADAVSPAVTAGNVLTSLVAFFVAYAIIFSAGSIYIIRLVWKGPPPPDQVMGHDPHRGLERPMSAAEGGAAE
ncbi:MAG TPA: cytochrome ubiquinol oxidase subunit I [Rhodospirillales bacterium]|nr:cytochrome ubiquinol oxidase subunit I [Rhodospirillales bacterium]